MKPEFYTAFLGVICLDGVPNGKKVNNQITLIHFHFH